MRGLVYNTWPGIDGALIPAADRLWFDAPWWRNLFENTLTVQFDHRMVAYTLWLVALLHLADVIRARRGGGVLNGALALFCVVTVQAGIGIVTLLHQAPLPLALLHQITGIAVLTIAVIHAERLSQGARHDRAVFEHRSGIAILRMAHGKANALDIEFCDAIAAQFDAARGDDTKAIVLTGQGAMFSAGVDLLRLSEGGAAYVRRFLPALHRLYDAVFFCRKPVVAAVNGHAIAGGCVLQACADRRIAAAGSRPHRRH